MTDSDRVLLEKMKDEMYLAATIGLSPSGEQWKRWLSTLAALLRALPQTAEPTGKEIWPLVIRAQHLERGKGVVVVDTVTELLAALTDLTAHGTISIERLTSPVLSSPSAAPQEPTAEQKIFEWEAANEYLTDYWQAPTSEGGKILSLFGRIRRVLSKELDLAASQGVSAPAVAEIEQEMRELAARGEHAHGLTVIQWADRLAALRGEQK